MLIHPNKLLSSVRAASGLAHSSNHSRCCALGTSMPRRRGTRRTRASLALPSAHSSSWTALALLPLSNFHFALEAAAMSLSPTKSVQHTARKDISSRAVTGGQQACVRRALCCKSVANTGAGQPHLEPLAASVAQSLEFEAPLHPRVAAERHSSPVVDEVGRCQQQQRHQHVSAPSVGVQGQPAAPVCHVSVCLTAFACDVWHRSLYFHDYLDFLCGGGRHLSSLLILNFWCLTLPASGV